MITDQNAVVHEATKDPQPLDTSNGLIVADKVLHMQIEAFESNVSSYTLEDTPNVLNVGTRCKDEGYGFHWEPWSDKPYLYDKFKTQGLGSGSVVCPALAAVSSSSPATTKILEEACTVVSDQPIPKDNSLSADRMLGDLNLFRKSICRL